MTTKVSEKITNNLAEIRQQLQILAEESPHGQSVRLLAVSKKHSLQAIQAAIQAGQMHFGENYVQEAVDKITQLKEQVPEPVQWHFIGPVQSNKTKDISQHFNWVQSVEREKIARRLNEQRPDDLEQLNVLLQVNIDDDDNKSGLMPEHVEALAEYVMNCPKLKLRGLMTILKAGTTEEQRKQSFQSMFRLYEQLQQAYGEQIDTLSMGMSGDMRQAVLEGANMVRIGTAIFGERES
ncbi:MULTISPECIES: YggS family pyridoxal phosphate-dependent enzyme [Idiomarina]|uniref:YggS family pyridoxal phosphate-dependent enzyme n=1 Tax=Idiomarina TaxID=135575 RepID=UPI000C46483E|nr:MULTISPECIES: YggS family pyridoxal phosphate-dependent enzyme [Idiomarina]MAO69146.1 YggS family pyridoxal phosphate-dependent enzyme [Idiomarina sp.]MBF81757.1 YggS family pyridoxal phosphate-dependent enzyme [Idiomarina sp.]